MFTLFSLAMHVQLEFPPSVSVGMQEVHVAQKLYHCYTKIRDPYNALK